MDLSLGRRLTKWLSEAHSLDTRLIAARVLLPPPVLSTSSVSLLCTALSYSTLSHPPSPLLLFRGVFHGASPLPDRALCQSSLRWLHFPGHRTSPVYSIFLGKHLYKDSKSLHVHISINRLTESALRDLSQAQWKYLIESTLEDAF